MFSLNARNALVTGASTGLGQADAVELTRAGARVAIFDISGVSFDETAAL